MSSRAPDSRSFCLRAGWTLDQPLPYRIEEEIGRGGLSTVYRAVLADSSDPRPVALKMLHLDGDPDEISRRFQRESEILAELRHPGMAQLLGGGIAEDGRPYLVMELIDGETLSSYMATAEPSLPDRIRLFMELCEIVAYAHRRLVVHRDLKPGNVMVTSDGKPKLLDFGISKLIHARTATTDLTQGVSALTPEYASPEQLRGLPLTINTDIYSLGVMLHEALVGCRPHAVAGDRPGRGPMAEQKRETPSRAAARQGELTLARSLSGDLDAIVDRCLQPEPELRYPSVERLADDLDRYLTGRPITTRPATIFYRGRKLLSRHRYAFGAALMVLLAMTAFFWDREQRRQVLTAERDQAAVVNDFLIDLFRFVEPETPLRANSSLKSIVDLGAQRHDLLRDSPRLHAELGGVLGDLYIAMGDFESAEQLLKESRQTFHAVHGSAPNRDLVRAELRLGRWTGHMGRLGASQAWRQKARADAGELSEHRLEAQALLGIGMNLQHLLTYDRAERSFEEAISLLAGLDQPSDLANARFQLAATIQVQGRASEAKVILDDALTALEEEVGSDHTILASGYWKQAVLIWIGEGNPAASEPSLRRAYEISHRVSGTSHSTTLQLRAVLGNLMLGLGRIDEANAWIGQNLKLMESNPNLSPRAVAATHSVLSTALVDEGRLTEAEQAIRQALAATAKSVTEWGAVPRFQVDISWYRYALADILLDQGRLREAEHEISQAHSTMTQRRATGVSKRLPFELLLEETRVRRGCGNEVDEMLRAQLAKEEPEAVITRRSRLAFCWMDRDPARAVEWMTANFGHPDFSKERLGRRYDYYRALHVRALLSAGEIDARTAIQELEGYLDAITAPNRRPFRPRFIEDVRGWLDTARQEGVSHGS